MAIRKEQSSYNDSVNLKTAMIAKNVLDPMDIGHVYYSGGATEKHLLIADNGDNTFRTVVRLGGGSVDFDNLDNNDPIVVRMWTKRELDVFILSIEGIENSSHTFNGTIYTHTIVHNGVSYAATDTKLVDAITKATTTMLNALPGFSRLG